MIFLAVCHDRASEGADRTAVFDQHVHHMLRQLDICLFAAPTANEDGVDGGGDDPRLAGSLFFFDTADAATVVSVVGADPFIETVWDRVEYFAVTEIHGTWLDTSQRPKGLAGPERYYAALSARDAVPANCLIHAAIAPVHSEQGGAAYETIAIFAADSLDHARLSAPSASLTLSLPVAIGKWVGLTSIAEIMAARG